MSSRDLIFGNDFPTDPLDGLNNIEGDQGDDLKDDIPPVLDTIPEVNLDLDNVPPSPETLVAIRNPKTDGTSGTTVSDSIIVYVPPVLPSTVTGAQSSTSFLPEAVSGDLIASIYVECETSFEFSDESHEPFSKLSCYAGRYAGTRESLDVPSIIEFVALKDGQLDKSWSVDWNLDFPSTDAGCETSSQGLEFHCEFLNTFIDKVAKANLTLTPSEDSGYVVHTTSGSSVFKGCSEEMNNGFPFANSTESNLVPDLVIICSEQQFNRIADKNTYAGKTPIKRLQMDCFLASDLDFTDKSINMIGGSSGTDSFEGRFYSDGKEVSGVALASEKKNPLGLFGLISSAVLSDFKL